jgi:hypothetical protein
MYQRQLTDPDGNILEFGYMDPVAAEQEAWSSWASSVCTACWAVS